MHHLTTFFALATLVACGSADLDLGPVDEACPELADALDVAPVVDAWACDGSVSGPDSLSMDGYAWAADFVCYNTGDGEECEGTYHLLLPAVSQDGASTWLCGDGDWYSDGAGGRVVKPAASDPMTGGCLLDMTSACESALSWYGEGSGPWIMVTRYPTLGL